MFNILILLFFISCNKNTIDVIPKRLGTNKNIELLKKNNIVLDFTNCKEEKIICQALQEYIPIQASKGSYKYRNISIMLYILKFSQCNDAFGFYATTNHTPQRVLNNRNIIISKKGNIISGYQGNYVVFFNSKPGNYFAFYKQNIITILKKLNAQPCKLEYHYKILPSQNRYKNSIFYTKSKHIESFFLQNAFGAYYQIGLNRSTIYVDNLYSYKQANKIFFKNIKNLNKQKIKVHRFTDMTTVNGQSYWFKNQNGITIMHNYRWLNFYITGLSDLKNGNSLLRAMYRNMTRIRKDLKWLPQK